MAQLSILEAQMHHENEQEEAFCWVLELVGGNDMFWVIYPLSYLVLFLAHFN